MGLLKGTLKFMELVGSEGGPIAAVLLFGHVFFMGLGGPAIVVCAFLETAQVCITFTVTVITGEEYWVCGGNRK